MKICGKIPIFEFSKNVLKFSMFKIPDRTLVLGRICKV